MGRCSKFFQPHVKYPHQSLLLADSDEKVLFALPGVSFAENTELESALQIMK